MKQELLMIRDKGCLKPYAEEDDEIFSSISSKRPILVSIHQARNPLHHAKLWALASAVSKFGDHFEDAEAAVRWVKRQIPNMHRKYRDREGSLVVELESISWASMDQVRFNRFYDRALWLWSQKIGCDPETLLDAKE